VGRLLAGATRPVAVAPRDFSSRAARFESIGVGLDGTVESRRAVAEAARIAETTGASLTLVCVFDPRDPVQVAEAAVGYAAMVTPPRMTRQQVDRLWAMARRVVRELPIEVAATIKVIEGEAATVLSELSDRFDLLVLGSRCHGPFGRVLTGSVSAAVLRRSRCPVLVTPRPDTAPEDGDGAGSSERNHERERAAH
jgi:nucleotide-binding universal stress UspA family protein